ncbi:uncharacterized protein BX664DRAFT_328334 [Halteromyces radiatus]|uniref:uncharacterized protein n=1 Tax=Halteromyces radiatus TaxID=101107 RepID=UPI0022210962|nr:uncharacterized protein BX664DRAFT_328334 [Halteromyces radiatus]KAI8092861.1 hypothetical protein BX664DRAFT_328334 [Halteromyces radiatus]
MINKKQGNAPREAATAIVRIINSKNINQAMLALTLLDNCVKNCGYPFHLQIGTKEFLNELVRRFPERPAPFPSPVIQRILYLIKEWKVALTDMSRHKDDLVHIKDMYRLLRFKGYRFPDLRDSSIAALAPSESLKSAQELEEEDRVAQSAKLQELIRRGRPQDLVEANHLMKIMSGYDQRAKPDYKQKFEEELHKIQDKAILLYEMLENVAQGERLDRNETVMELKHSCQNAQPKIQKMITEEEDNDKIENLLTLNDMINNVIAKFADIQKGIYDTQYDISGKPPKQTSTTEEPRQAISLIDLDDDSTLSNNTPTASGSALNELSDLFGQTNISSVPATIPTMSTPSSSNMTSNNPSDIFDLLSGSNAPPAYSVESPVSATNPPVSVSPALSNTSFNGFGSPRQQHQRSIENNNSNDGSLLSSSSTNSNGSAQTHPTIELVNKNGLRIELEVRQISTQWKFKALFSNQSTAPMENMTLSLAAPKSMQLKMETQSSQVVPPHSQNSVTQFILLNNPNNETLRLRYKVTYQQFGVDMEQTGDYRA